MEGKEVNELQKLENRASENECKSDGYISVKLNILTVAFHNIESSHLSDPKKSEKIHDWVPFPCGSFVDMCLDAFFMMGQDSSKKFLDIGCGIGTKVMLADVVFDAYGFDLNEEYLNLAKQIGCKKVWKQDAFVYDNYKEFDFVYFYAPFKDESLELEFETRVYQQMKPGSLLAPMHSVVNWNIQPNVKQVGRWLYQKV